MTKGMQEAGLPSMGCVAHTLQLSVKRSLASQQSLDTALALCRKIATHFSHSTLAKEKLREIQQTLQLPEHVMMQDVQTRWNSTFYMVVRRVCGSAVSSRSGVWGRAPAEIEFGAF